MNAVSTMNISTTHDGHNRPVLTQLQRPTQQLTCPSANVHNYIVHHVLIHNTHVHVKSTRPGEGPLSIIVQGTELSKATTLAFAQGKLLLKDP